MYSYQCYECDALFFNELAACHHLKQIHKLNDNISKFKCLVNFDLCKKTYVTFSGLKRHHANCLKKYPQVCQKRKSQMYKININL